MQRDPFWAGLEAGYERKPLYSNPHPHGSDKHERWQEGWMNGMDPDYGDRHRA